jgi:chaperonin GroEL (HSP60 family)
MFKHLQGQEAINKLASGIHKLAEAVRKTLGPGGKLALIKTLSGVLHSTKDGVTVASHFNSDCPSVWMFKGTR